ncbi:MAG: hypothetical protein ACLQLC_07935 [Candidatus Sulfotelmatobacter sp.]
MATVIMVPAREDLTAIHGAHPQAQPLYSPRMPILGNDVLRAWTKRVRTLGVQNLWLTSTPADGRGTWFAFAEFARQGIERFLIIKLKSYAEIDLADFVNFHRESGNSVTQAQDCRGLLGVSLLDRAALLDGKDLEFRDAAARNPYEFRGYAKRILSARERQELVGDALVGACSMRPRGTEIREQVWVGRDVQLADSVRIIGPSYIGERTIVRAGATIGPFASVERDCVVDCGTEIERSTVLPFSYVGAGLLFQHKLVDGRYLVDLLGGEVGGEVADLQPAGLGNRILFHGTARQRSRRTRANEPVHAGAAACGFAPFSTASQPWLQVQM